MDREFVLEQFSTSELVEHLIKRLDVKFHYMDEGMEGEIETNETFSQKLEGPIVLLEIEDY